MKSRLIQETVGYEGACEMLDCGKNTILNLCKAGELASTCLLYTSILLIALMLFNNSSFKVRLLEKRAMRQMEKAEKAGGKKEGA